MGQIREFDAISPPEDESSYPGPMYLGASIAALAVVLVAGYFWYPLSGSQAQSSPDPAPSVEILPISPRQPEGLTILVKQGKAEEGREDHSNYPESNEPEGFAIELGVAKSFSELTRRFSRIVEINAELGLDLLEPRAVLVESRGDLTARLLVGPFKTADEASVVCANIALPAGIRCRWDFFAGERIARR